MIIQPVSGRRPYVLCTGDSLINRDVLWLLKLVAARQYTTTIGYGGGEVDESVTGAAPSRPVWFVKGVEGQTAAAVISNGIVASNMTAQPKPNYVIDNVSINDVAVGAPALATWLANKATIHGQFLAAGISASRYMGLGMLHRANPTLVETWDEALRVQLVAAGSTHHKINPYYQAWLLAGYTDIATDGIHPDDTTLVNVPSYISDLATSYNVAPTGKFVFGYWAMQGATGVSFA